MRPGQRTDLLQIIDDTLQIIEPLFGGKAQTLDEQQQIHSVALRGFDPPARSGV